MQDLLRKSATRALLPISQTKPKWALEIKEFYGDENKILVTFNPSKQIEYCEHLERCFIGLAPTLHQMKIAYSVSRVEMWLEIQLHDLSEYTGVTIKPTPEQLEAIAQTIILKFGYLKLTELMVFFQKFKAGEYGVFYGSFDGLLITAAIVQFLTYRSHKLDEYENIKRQVQREKDRMNKVPNPFE